MILGALFLLLTCFYLLAIICEDYFVVSLDMIADRLRLSSDVAGATLMAMGSSAPELFTSLFAVLHTDTHTNIGTGTIVGSAIFNILVIIGASALFRRAQLSWQPIVRDMIFYILAIFALLFVFWDGKIVASEAMFFIGLYVLYVFIVTQWRKILPYDDVTAIDIVQDSATRHPFIELSNKLVGYVIPRPKKEGGRYILTFIASILLIALLSYLLVESAVYIAATLHISATIIALTVLAAGTSVPDLFSSIIVAKQGRGDMAISNAVGSNIFDILFGLGVPWGIVLLMGRRQIEVSSENLLSSIFLLFATVVAILFVLIIRKWTIGRRSGLILIGLYITYLLYNISLVL